jgi:hypothetical protein
MPKSRKRHIRHSKRKSNKYYGIEPSVITAQIEKAKRERKNREAELAARDIDRRVQERIKRHESSKKADRLLRLLQISGNSFNDQGMALLTPEFSRVIGALNVRSREAVRQIPVNFDKAISPDEIDGFIRTFPNASGITLSKECVDRDLQKIRESPLNVYLSYLNISNTRITNAGFGDSSIHLRNLKILNVSSCRDITTDLFDSDRFQHLEKLNIEHTLINFNELSTSRLVHLTNLRHLHMRRNSSSGQFLNRLKTDLELDDDNYHHLIFINLRHLDVSWCRNVTDDHIKNLFQLNYLNTDSFTRVTGVGFQHLRRLNEVSTSVFVVGEYLRYLPSTLQRLVLNTSGAYIRDEDIQHLTGLTHLKLDGSRTISGSAFVHFTNLTHLTCSTERVTYDNLLHLATTLTYLDISKTLGDGSVLSHFTNLNHLVIDNCPNVRNQHLIDMYANVQDKLTHFSMGNCFSIVTETLRILNQRGNLKYLNISNAGNLRGCLKFMTSLTHLVMRDCTGLMTRYPDIEQDLNNLVNLVSLNIIGTFAIDLRHIILPNLSRIMLSDTHLQGLELFKRNNMNCEVVLVSPGFI